MPKLNLHLDTKRTIDFEGLQWNDSLLAVQPKFPYKKQQQALKLVLCNVAKYHNKRLLYYRRNEKMIPELHNPQQISWRSIKGVIDQLIKNGMVEAKKGNSWNSVSPEEREMSSFVARPILLELVEALGLNEKEVIESYHTHIGFKTEQGKYIEYEPTPYTKRIEKIMSEICGFINQHSITLEDESLLPIHLKRQYRDYTGRKEFVFGGRAWSDYMWIPETDRKRILINGQPTQSVDYSSSVPSIVYQLMTGTPKQDVELLIAPYDIKGMHRKVAKRIFNILLNTNKLDAIRGVNGHFNNPKCRTDEKAYYLEAKKYFGDDWNKKMIDAVMEKNQAVSQVFLQGKVWGQHWAWLEANLVYEVAWYSTTILEIPMLIIHDEFLVTQDKAEAIADVMYTTGLPHEYDTAYTNHIFNQEPQSY